eukprot:TRINITY_DN9120_c0_g1_i3.p1 TRINITY_DN9120_c0_g1~~TRINITY_DN9120_c0_g1_i3.p1  ORF type:complete len:697 (+),score=179.36 TRINITY_DN9120_c0_g1_i3:201-2093(+)
MKERRKAERKDREFGRFEQFGSGIGSKLLQKFGYKGKGLGKKEDGRVNPVEAIKRANQTHGIGFGKMYIPNRDDEDEEQEDEEEEGSDVQETDFDSRPPPGFPNSSKEQQIPQFLPEFRELIGAVDLADVEKRVVVQQQKAKRDKLNALRQRRAQLSTGIEQLEENKERLKAFRQILSGCQNLLSSGKLTSTGLCKVFHTLQSHYVDLYEKFEINKLVPGLVFPCVSEEMMCWDPTKEFDFPISTLLSWKPLLSGRILRKERFDLFSMFVVEVLFSRLSTYVCPSAIETEMETVTKVVELFEVLKNVVEVSPEVVTHFSRTVLIPALKNSVVGWTRGVSRFTLESLVHPWLPILEFELQHDREILADLYNVISSKLISEIRTRWDGISLWPTAVIENWRPVLGAEGVAKISQNGIIPVLNASMEEFVVFPPDQSLAIPRAFFSFKDLVPIADLIKILLKHFFKKWFHVLDQWLSLSENVNYLEIASWYGAWKAEFPASFLHIGIIKEQFMRCLQIIERSYERRPFKALTRHCVHFLDVYEVPQKSVTSKPTRVIEIGSEETVRMEEVLQSVADQNGLVFAPNFKRELVQGRQVFNFGNVSVVLERNSVRLVRDFEVGMPVSLEELVQLAS